MTCTATGDEWIARGVARERFLTPPALVCTLSRVGRDGVQRASQSESAGIGTWGRPDSPIQTLFSVRTACLIGVAGAVVTVAIADLPTVGVVIGSISLLLLFGTYPAFSLAWHDRDGRAAE